MNDKEKMKIALGLWSLPTLVTAFIQQALQTLQNRSRAFFENFLLQNWNFVVQLKGSVLHWRTSLRPVASRHVVTPLRRAKTSTCVLHRKVEQTIGTNEHFFGLRLATIANGKLVAALIVFMAPNTTALFNNKADIFGFALIPRQAGNPCLALSYG